MYKKTIFLIVLIVVVALIIIFELILLNSKNPISLPSFIPFSATTKPQQRALPSILPEKGITDLSPGRIVQISNSFFLVAYLYNVDSDASGNIFAILAFYPNGVQGKVLTQKVYIATRTQGLSLAEQTNHTYRQYPNKQGENTPIYSFIPYDKVIQKLTSAIGSEITLNFVNNNPYIKDKTSSAYKDISCNNTFLAYLTTGTTPLSCIPYASSINIYAEK